MCEIVYNFIDTIQREDPRWFLPAFPPLMD